MDDAYLWEALRCTELNPVRAGMVEMAESWKWSSSPAHCGTAEPDLCLSMGTWGKAWSHNNWREFLQAGQMESQPGAIRQCTHTGRPLGSGEFIEALEKATSRQLAPRKGGRPAMNVLDQNQSSIIFDP